MSSVAFQKGVQHFEHGSENVGGCLVICQPGRFVFNHPCLDTKVGTTPLMIKAMKMMSATPNSPCCSGDLKPEGRNVILMSTGMSKASLSTLCKCDVSLSQVGELLGQKVQPVVC